MFFNKIWYLLQHKKKAQLYKSLSKPDLELLFSEITNFLNSNS